MRTHVDRGGTFTDVVRVHDDRVEVLKVPSDRAVVGELARGELTFGTTVATNALLERRGARTLLLVTRGFGDLLRLRHMARPSLFDPDAAWPPPLAQRVVEVGGRVAA
ncbi:MAG TPA: hydantoinase/oxoprolinase N-terminal domain-containing protein, partial [Myxococcota bacterium]|nr:hydantoinase/oxoprolinase N-terminal domain-containing protein [Myxococcota bacterium]